jgi:hypothetical protein
VASFLRFTVPLVGGVAGAASLVAFAWTGDFCADGASGCACLAERRLVVGGRAGECA